MSVTPIRSVLLGLALGLVLLGIPSVSRSEGLNAPTPPTLTGLEAVHAAFISGAGEAGIRSVQMFLDGREVTAGAEMGTVRIAYKPTEQLSVGTHSAKVIVVDALGRTFVKEWSFEVLAPARPEVIAFFSDTLAIDLDPLSRNSLVPRATIAGTTLPGAEVSVRLDQSLVERVIADMTGRFSVRVNLARGENELTISAARLDTGAEGVEIIRRIDHVPLASVITTRPPAADPTTPQRARDERVAQRVKAPPLAEIHFEIPDDDDDTPPPPIGEVVITKPSDGQALHSSHVTVLGRAPAGWDVVLLVNGDERAEDRANPAGHFTMPNVELGGGGEHRLIAEATSAEGETLRSATITVRVAGAAALGGGALAATFRGGPSLSIQSPTRGSTVARDRSTRVEGFAWDGAQVDVEVNGRVVATEIAGANGRFVVNVPLEVGSNLLVIEVGAQDGSRMERSQAYLVTAPAIARSRQGAHDPVPVRGGPPRGFQPAGDAQIRPLPIP